MFNKLRNKFLMLNMIITLIIMFLSFFTIYLITYNSINKENEDKLKNAEIMPISTILLPRNRNVIFSNNDENVMIIQKATDFSTSFSVFLDKNDDILRVISSVELPFEFYENIIETALKNENNNVVSIDERKFIFNVRKDVDAIVENRNGGLVFARVVNGSKNISFLDITDSKKILTELLITFIFIGLGMTVVVFLVSLYFANKAIKPISETWDKQKQFITDASHELKTPIAIISANTDVLWANAESTVISQKKWISYIQAEIVRMNKLVSDLLYLSKTEDVQSEIQFVSFDLSEIVSDAVLTVEAMIFEKGITLSQNIEEEVIIKADGEKLKQVIMILLDNAVKYVDSNGKIDIVLEKNRHNISFTIKNTGEKIDKNDISRLFDRFYRADSSRSYENGGYGLGLSIAKTIIERHNGKLTVLSDDEWTSFSFIL